MKLWSDGKLQKSSLTLSPWDRGLTLGDGLFETLLVSQGIALWRFEHLQRMQAAANELGIEFPSDEIENAIDGMCHRTRNYAVLRLTLTRGEGGRGLAAETRKPFFMATLVPFDQKLQFLPMSLMTSSIRRNLASPACRMKTLSYVDQVLAARAAVAQGFDDALMLNSKGRVACSTIGNVFMLLDDVLVTPALSEGILPGIMREAVLQAAHDLGMRAKQRVLKVSDINNAKAMFVTNSLRFVRPVTRLDDKTFSPVGARKLKGLIAQLAHVVQDQIELS